MATLQERPVNFVVLDELGTALRVFDTHAEAQEYIDGKPELSVQQEIDASKMSARQMRERRGLF